MNARRLIRYGAAVLASLLVIACSDGGNTATAPSPTPETEPEASATVDPDAVAYRDPANWICRPGKAPSPCTANLDATVRTASGVSEVEPFRAAVDPRVDCFYVYPTVSSDPGPNSDLLPSTENAVTQSQAARFGSVCRVFAPLYRQLTLATISGGVTAGADARARAYGDVLAAWRLYLAEDNHGRGFVLIGHSQGSSHLLRLIREEIDANPQLRSRLVSALLIGATVTGGSFANVPACSRPEQTGCVVSYASFSAASPPPPASLFGRGNALCVNPASPGGGSAEMHPYLTAAGSPLGAGITTPYIVPRSLVRAECVNENGFSYLRVTADPSLQLPAYGSGPQWGLHVYDVSLTIGDLVALVARQSAAYVGGAR